MVDRPDLVGEVRFKVPLVLVIPLGAVALIAAVTWIFSRVLLSIPAGAATTVAIITAANILGACAYLALRPRASRASVVEVVLVALYPIIISLVIAQTGFATTSESEPAARAPETQPAGPATDAIAAEGLSFDADVIALKPNSPTKFELDNRDSVVHNLVIFPSEQEASDPGSALFTSPDVAGGSSETFTIDPLKRGEYFFHCQYHLSMNGTVQVGT